MQQQQQQVEQLKEEQNPVALCGSNLETVVECAASHYREVTYTVGALTFIENAD